MSPLGSAVTAFPASDQRRAGSSADVPIAIAMMRSGLLSADAFLDVMACHKKQGGRIEDILVASRRIDGQAMAQLVAERAGLDFVDPLVAPADPALVDRLGAARCLRDRILPWRSEAEETVVLVVHPRDFERHRAHLTAIFGKVVPAIASASSMNASVIDLRGAELAAFAETRVAPSESCREIGNGAFPWAIGVVTGILIVISIAVPWLSVAILAGWAVFTLLAVSLLKLLALAAAFRSKAAPVRQVPLATPPLVSLLVPLYREAAIATRLVRRLERLDYPRDRLDVILVAEDDDMVTQTALVRADLPVWMRVAVAPAGTIRTKPRALNYALDLCRGSIVGVYDAEDAPAPDQLRRVVARFANSPPEVACLQGVLDYYNPRRNWLSRCFTIEYAGWFRILLPGIARLGIPVPLGGTTLFFRRPALEALGGWDAHNVTEDADLGIRLARRGLRTELIDSVTLEEATSRPIAWIKQRSRWVKGYMMTWAVHMRRPGQLWRELGPLGFVGFQILFLGSLSQFLLAPVLWSFWLVAMGMQHPAADIVPAGMAFAALALFLSTEAINLTVALFGLRRRGGGVNPLWCLTLPLYFPLAVVAAYKALWEIGRRPFYWDKTAHGGPQQAARPDA